MSRLYLYLIMATACAPLLGSAPADKFAAGNSAYAEADYEAAIGFYAEALEHTQSAPLHYNLGNANFKAGNIGHAILHYEKARALTPGDPDIAGNLRFVRNHAELPDPDTAWHARLAHALPVSTWCWLAAGSFWAAFALALLPRLYGVSGLTARGLSGACGVLLAVSMAALGGYHLLGQRAILTGEDTLRIAPAPESPGAQPARAGEAARVTREHGAFVYLVFEGDKPREGWTAKAGKVWD